MFCSPYSDLAYLIFTSQTPKLLYYSHIPTSLIAIILGGFLLFHNRKAIEVKILAILAVLFSAWSIIDLFLWVVVNPSTMVYLWSFWFTFLPLLFALAFYFLYSFIKQHDLPFKGKLVIAATFIPTFVSSFLGLNISFFNAIDCAAINSTLAVWINYVFAAVYFAAIITLTLREAAKAQADSRKKILVVSSSLLLFLLCFMTANFIPDIISLINPDVHTFSLEQYGYFGMAFFMGLLGYAVVKYKAFNVKLIATQALVASLAILIGSEFFFAQSTATRVLICITLALALYFGYFLVKSVKKEIETREKIERLARDLKVANSHLEELNKQKSEFVSFASHQLRSPLASIKGNASMMLEGDFGELSPLLKEAVKTIAESVTTQINIVEDYLNISRIELGTMKYDMRDMDFKDIVKEVINEQKPNIDAKGLTFTVSIDESQTYRIKVDPDKFKQVVMNTIDNSVKYTPQGSLSISLAKDAVKGVIRLRIADTGVGIRADVIPKLFQKFSRAPHANEANIHGTGLGLYIAKQIMDAHKGKIWAESEGEGKGSQFYIELPEAK